MNTTTSTRNKLHPLVWLASIALTIFSIVGISAIMGWIPTSTATPGPSEMLGNSVAREIAPSRKTPDSPVNHASAASHKAPQKPASSAPAHTSTSCVECGVIESVRDIQIKGEGSAVGVVGGAVVGGLLGNQMGAGTGKDIMTVVGAVGGAMAGNEVEKRAKSTTAKSVTVRFANGTSHVFNEPGTSAWRSGDKVKVISGVIQSNA